MDQGPALLKIRIRANPSEQDLLSAAKKEWSDENTLPDRFHDRAGCLRLVHGINMNAVCTVLL